MSATIRRPKIRTISNHNSGDASQVRYGQSGAEDRLDVAMDDARVGPIERKADNGTGSSEDKLCGSHDLVFGVNIRLQGKRDPIE